VRKFLDDLNGQSHLQSEVDKGTRVEIMIPYPLPLLTIAELTIDSESLAPEKLHSAEYPSVKPVSQDKASEPVGFDRKHRILLVEDDAIAAKVAKNVLSQCDCDVDWAQNGKAALGLIENHHYDLIFMDIGLPDINGYEVTQRIRSHRLDSVRHIPVVALSAHAHKDNQQSILESQINLMLSKPLTLAQAKDALHLFIPGQQDSPVVSSPSPVTEQKTTTSQEKVIDFDYAKNCWGITMPL
jgi:FOG: CheY-like receiver